MTGEGRLAVALMGAVLVVGIVSYGPAVRDGQVVFAPVPQIPTQAGTVDGELLIEACDDEGAEGIRVVGRVVGVQSPVEVVVSTDEVPGEVGLRLGLGQLASTTMSGEPAGGFSIGLPWATGDSEFALVESGGRNSDQRGPIVRCP